MRFLGSFILVAILFAQAYSQIMLKGTVKEDGGKPIPNLTLTVDGAFSATSDGNGRFVFSFPSNRVYDWGTRINLIENRADLVIYQPFDGAWHLPQDANSRNTDTALVLLLPKGHPKLLSGPQLVYMIEGISEDRNKTRKEISQLRRENQLLLAEINMPEPIDFSEYLEVWSSKYGFTKEEIKKKIDEWASISTTGDDFRTRGAKAYYKEEFREAMNLYSQSARSHEGLLALEREDAIRDWTSAGKVAMEDYAFDSAIIFFRRARAHAEDNENIEIYSETVIDLGSALVQRGVRVSGREGNQLLEEAAFCYLTILGIVNKDKYPIQWAKTQKMLGQAWDELGLRIEGEKGNDLLSDAIISYNHSLEIYTKDRFPKEWASLQNDIGAVFYSQAMRAAGEAGRELVRQSILSSNSALSIFTRDSFPEDWACVYINLGNAYSLQSRFVEPTNVVSILEAAKVSLLNALEIFTREDYPEGWALLNNNLGNVITDQADQIYGEGGKHYLNQAFVAYQNALTIFSPDKLPQGWAMVQHNLGNLFFDLFLLAEEMESKELLIESINAYKNALLVRTFETIPSEWALEQSALASTLCSLSMYVGENEREKLLHDALVASDSAFIVYTRSEFPQDWAVAQCDRALILYELAKISSNDQYVDLFSESLVCCYNALEIFSNDVLAVEWSRTQRFIGNVLCDYGVRVGGEIKENYLSEAEKSYSNALLIHTADFLPNDFEETIYCLAELYEQWGKWDSARIVYFRLMCLDTLSACQNITRICNDHLFDFGCAFDQSSLLIQEGLGTLVDSLKHLECFFTSNRFREGAHFAGTINFESSADSIKLIIKTFELAFKMGINEPKFTEQYIGELTFLLMQQPPNYSMKRTFLGIKHFVNVSPSLKHQAKWFHAYFEALEQPDRDRIISTLNKLPKIK